MSRPVAPIPKRPNGTGSVKAGPDSTTWKLVLPEQADGSKPSRRFKGTEREAHKALDTWISEVAAGLVAIGRVPTIGELAIEHRDNYLRDNLAESNQSRTTWIINTLILGENETEGGVKDGALRRIRVNDLTVADVEAWMGRMLARGNSRNTIKGYRTPLVTILERATTEPRYRLSLNVASLAKLPKNAPRTAREIVWLDRPQAEAFFDQCADPKETWGPFFAIHGLLGLRPGEVFGLTREHFDLDKMTARIEQALKRVDDEPVAIGELKTARQGRRVVDLPDRAMHAYKRQLDLLVEHSVTPADPRWAGLIFLRDSGVPTYQSSVRKALRAMLGRIRANGIEMPDITPYSLRHTCASIMLDVERPNVEHVARMIGTSPEMLREHYWHILAEREVVRGFADTWN